jgi:hypothetical protein
MIAEEIRLNQKGIKCLSEEEALGKYNKEPGLKKKGKSLTKGLNLLKLR